MNVNSETGDHRSGDDRWATIGIVGVVNRNHDLCTGGGERAESKCYLLKNAVNLPLIFAHPFSDFFKYFFLISPHLGLRSLYRPVFLVLWPDPTSSRDEIMGKCSVRVPVFFPVHSRT